MIRLGTQAFWLSLALAACLAFGAQPGLVRWLAIAWLGLFGSIFALSNWACLFIQTRKQGRRPSLIPLFGGVLVVAAVAAIPARAWRVWAPAGLLLDPFFVMMLIRPAVDRFERRKRKRAKQD